MTTMLLLEDSLNVASVVIGALDRIGILVVHASTVGEARRLYQEGVYNVLLVDYELPDGTGIDFISNETEDDRTRTFLYSGVDRSRELEESGFNIAATFSKSDLPELLHRIEEITK